MGERRTANASPNLRTVLETVRDKIHFTLNEEQPPFVLRSEEEQLKALWSDMHSIRQLVTGALIRLEQAEEQDD